MSLSERLRPGAEAADWVIEEVRQMERALDAAQSKAREDEALFNRALAALTESLDAVTLEYEHDWRHGVPSRAAQLAIIKAQLDEHVALVRAIAARVSTSTVTSESKV